MELVQKLMKKTKKYLIYSPLTEKVLTECPCMFFFVQAEALESPKYLPAAITMDEVHFKECLIELLQDMFGEESVPKALAGDTVTVTVDNKDAMVSL